MDNYKPHIGKNVIETLTLGMYEDARFIYREYVQNAADQIDVAVEEGILDRKSNGEINIIIDKEEREIIVEDNATGIRLEDVLQFLGDVANSQKDRTKRKGFRGIGRLGGLGYCKKLIFETSYKGEDKKSTVTLNAAQLKRFIEDDTYIADAATVISVVTNLEKDKEKVDRHYFKVKLQKVTNDKLLDIENVRKYLSIVAPVPFRKDFKFAKKIYRFYTKKNIKIEEYDIRLNVNDKPLHKPYKTIIHSKTGNKEVRILDVDFLELRNDDDLLIAIGWYGISDLLNNIIHQDDYERGIRIRKDNIQIGDENTLNFLFKEDRFNRHFIGEVHVIGDSFEPENEFKPNARRDYFNDSKVVQIFEQKLRYEFDKIYKLAHTASEIHSSIKKIEKYTQEKGKLEAKKFRSNNEERQKRQELERLKEEAMKGMKALEKAKEKSNIDPEVKTIFDFKTNNINLAIDDENELRIKNVYDKPELSKLGKRERHLVFEIFELIEANLDVENAEKIKQIIIEHYN